MSKSSIRRERHVFRHQVSSVMITDIIPNTSKGELNSDKKESIEKMTFYTALKRSTDFS